MKTAFFRVAIDMGVALLYNPCDREIPNVENRWHYGMYAYIPIYTLDLGSATFFVLKNKTLITRVCWPQLEFALFCFKQKCIIMFSLHIMCIFKRIIHVLLARRIKSQCGPIVAADRDEFKTRFLTLLSEKSIKKVFPRQRPRIGIRVRTDFISQRF